MQAKLTGREEEALAVKPTNNPEAYDAYLRGLSFEARYSSSYSLDLMRKATAFYERAVQLDPNFAIGWGRLSRGHAFLYIHPRGETTAARRDAAKSALENAQTLQPNSPETLLALGYYQYWVLRDYGLAKTTFGHVSKMLPGSSVAPTAIAFVASPDARDTGMKALPTGSKALPSILGTLSYLLMQHSTYAALRQFPAALKLYDRAQDIVPNDPDLMASKANIYQAEGNLEQAGKFLSQINAETPSEIALLIKWTQLRLERNHAEAHSIPASPTGSIPTLLLNKTRPSLRSYWPPRSALPAIRLAQSLRLNRRAIRWESSAKVNQITPTLRDCCLWLMPSSARRTRH